MYNCANTIDKAILSIVSQNDLNYEVILIDDGSTDDTLIIANEISRNNSEVIKVFSKKNEGVSSARNLGIKYSKGEYICFLDADDVQKNNFLEYMRKQLKNCDYDLIIGRIEYSNIKRIDLDNSVTVIKGCNEVNLQVPDLLKENIFNSMVNKLYKKELLNKNNLKLNNTLNIGEDFDFNLKYIQYCEDICVINQYIYHYYVENSYLTKIIRDDDFYCRIDNIKNLEAFYRKNKININLDFQYVKIFYSDIYNELSKGSKKKLVKKRIKNLLTHKNLSNLSTNKKSIVQNILTIPIKTKKTNIIYTVAWITYFFRNINSIKKNQISI